MNEPLIAVRTESGGTTLLRMDFTDADPMTYEQIRMFVKSGAPEAKTILVQVK